MSASAPVSAPPPVPPASAAPRAVSPLAGFFIDLGIAAVTLFGLSLVSGLLWGLYRGVVVGYANAQAGAGAPDASSVAASLGQPGALAQILMALFATGGAALLLYFWRRPANAAERHASRQALRRSSTWGWTLLVATLIVLGSNGIAFLAKQFGVEPVPTNLALMQSAIARSRCSWCCSRWSWRRPTRNCCSAACCWPPVAGRAAWVGRGTEQPRICPDP